MLNRESGGRVAASRDIAVHQMLGRRGSKPEENRRNGGGKQLMGEGKRKHLLLMKGGQG